MLNGYVALRPKDEDALRELAGLYLARANALAQDAQIAQLRASYRTFGSTFAVPLDLGNGATIGTDPIDEAITTQASQEVNDRLREGAGRVPERGEHVREAGGGRPDAIRTSSWSSRRRRSRAGTTPQAIAAYQRFLSSRRTTRAPRSSSSRLRN